MFRLDHKVALVTGGSRGIGRAICQAFARQGATVVVNYAHSEVKAMELVQSLNADGGRCECLQFDVADSARVEAQITDCVKRLGKLDILVANAGIAIDGLLLRLKDEDLERMMAVNVRGALACARAALKSMIRARAGRVLFVSSVVGETGSTGQAGYAATKAALLGVTKTLAREYGARGVTVNAISPGFIDTDMTSGIDAAVRGAIVAQVPLGRLGTAADVASAAVFLCSDEASYVTGQVFRVNGGMHM
jgi:3-oxoacyl-[acyl-carrier protein] reductase